MHLHKQENTETDKNLQIVFEEYEFVMLIVSPLIQREMHTENWTCNGASSETAAL